MLPIALTELAERLGVDCRGDASRTVTGVAVDTRLLKEGGLFVALRGARVDGHDYLAEAQEAGAVAAVVAHTPGDAPPDLPLLLVPDPLAALAELARAQVRTRKPEIIGITGSVGKTTAKGFLAHLLGGEDAGIHEAPASYNSEIGLPLAVLAAPPACNRWVLEYGINARGEMAERLAVCRPDHVLLTALDAVHTEGLGGIEGVRAEKFSLAAALPASGHLWALPSLRSDLAEYLPDQAASLDAFRPAVITDPKPGAIRADFADLGEVVLPLVAEHEVELASLAASAALDLGIPAHLVQARLEDLPRPAGRLAWTKMGGIVVLDDSYNAGPLSMQAALQRAATWPGVSRRYAVLAGMHELGDEADAAHRRIGELAGRASFERIFCFGTRSEGIAEAAIAAGAAVSSHGEHAALLEELLATLRPGDLVLCKGSRAEGLDRTAQGLLTALTPPGVSR